MKLTSISNNKNIYLISRNKPSVIKPNKNKPTLTQSIYAKGSSKIAFGENLINSYLYDKSLVKHIHEAKEIKPELVENYFEAQGIPCSFKLGSMKARKVIAYCCFHASEIFRQINMVLPTKLDMEVNESPNTIAACYYRPYKNYPVRTVTFNTEYDWDNHMETSKEQNKLDKGYHSSGHFLQTFLHEFGHSVHNHHLYSKFGAPFYSPQYRMNPETEKILVALHMPIYDKKTGNIIYSNKFVTNEARQIIKQSSGYGSTLLPETFAEEFARAIIDCMNPMSLRLTKNPFPMQHLSPELQAVLYETWEGLVADTQGYIK